MENAKGTEPAMIDIKEAVVIANDHFAAFFSGKELGEILVDQFELSEDGKFWYITLSCDWHPHSGTGSIGPGSLLQKTLKIDSETGMVLGMTKETV